MDDKKIIIEKDGNAWCAHREDFVNLQESDAGFGNTPGEALELLIQNEWESFQKKHDEVFYGK